QHRGAGIHGKRIGTSSQREIQHICSLFVRVLRGTITSIQPKQIFLIGGFMATHTQIQIDTKQALPQTYFLTRDELAEFHTRGFLGPYDLMPANEIKALWKKLRLELFDRTK